MTPRKSAGETTVWLDNDGAATPSLLGQETRGQDAERPEAFGGGTLWIGQHSVDQDILVFDPAEEDPYADILSLYSLTQHRMRSFPRATVLDRIHLLTDDLAHARARKDYAQRAALRDAHAQAQAEARAERRERQRDQVVAAHRRFIETLGLTYAEVRETPPDHNPKRRTKCHACGIGLDDFASAVCGICSGVLCSCGACACGKPAQRR